MSKTDQQSHSRKPLDTTDSIKVSNTAKVVNRLGMHMRPMMQFVEAANQFMCDVSLIITPQMQIDGHPVIWGEEKIFDGKSIMQLSAAAMTRDTVVTIECEGPDAQQALDTLVKLIEYDFDNE